MKKIIILTLLFLGSSGLAQAQTQTGSIEVTVTDVAGETLPGATIRIQSIDRGGITNGEGKYTFANLEPGNYDLEVSFIGFETQIQTATARASEVTSVTISLPEASYQLEGLVVTAQKRSQVVKDVPIAISTLGADFLSRTNTFEFDALSEFVPGLQVQIQSNNNPGFVVRGITSDNGDSRVEPRVSVFQDGVSISKSRGSVVELYDLERTEVLKGPQGTLFGRGAQIGAVHLIQNKAKRNFSSQIRMGLGNEGQALFTGHVNVPLSDNFYMRVAGIYNHRDGFIDNLSGGNLNGKETVAGRLALKYLPGRNTSIDFIFNYQDDSPPGTSFKSGTYSPAGGDTNPNTFADMERGEELGLDRSVWGATAIVNHTLNPSWDLTSITAYREFDSFESFDADGTVADVLWFAEEAVGSQFSQELRFNYTDASGRFSGFTGASFFYEDGFQRVPYEGDERSLYALFTPFIRGSIQGDPNLPQNVKDQLLTAVPFEPLVVNGQPNLVAAFPNVPDVFGPLAGVPLKENHTEESTNFGENSAIEIFADGTYELSDELSLTAGIRGTYENISGAIETPEAPVPGRLGFLLTGGSGNNIFVPTARQETTARFLSAVGRVALDYKPTNDITLFANVARGRRPNVVQVTAVGTDILSAETVWSYEAGLKTITMEDRLQFDFNVFTYDYSNFQTSVAVADQQGFRIETRDAGKSSATGVEIAAQYAFAKGINGFANWGYIDARFDDQDSDGNDQNLAGNTFRLTPKHAISAGLDMNLDAGPNFSVYFRPTYSYKSRVFFEETNMAGIEQEGYGLLNLRIGARLNDKYDLMLFANNALDEEYIIDAGNTGGAFGIPTFIAGPPRLIGAQFSITFK